MRALVTLVPIVLLACGGGRSTEGDTSTDTAPDAADTLLDTASDTAADTASDTAVEPPEDSAGDVPEDVHGDAGHDAISGCESAGGTCVAPVAGCTVCPPDALPHHSRHGCPEDEWCCMPGVPGDTACETAGGVCIPVIPDSSCAPGWTGSTLECSGEGSGCCQPSDSCA